MFSTDANTLLLMGLVTIASVAVIVGLLFNKISNERNQERRIKSIKSNEGDRINRIAAEERLADAQKRRQSTQDSLKELEIQTNAKNPNKKGIKDQMRQAGLKGNVKQFVLFSFLAAIISVSYTHLTLPTTPYV